MRGGVPDRPRVVEMLRSCAFEVAGMSRTLV